MVSKEENMDDEFYNDLLSDLITPSATTATTASSSFPEPQLKPNPALNESVSNLFVKQTNEAALDDMNFDTFAQELALGMEEFMSKLDLSTNDASQADPKEDKNQFNSFQTRVQQTMDQLKASSSTFEHPSSASNTSPGSNLFEGLDIDPDAKLDEIFKNLSEQLQQGLVDESTSEAFSNDLMNSLLSKDILIEPLQMLKKHYEPFLDKNKSSLSSEQLSKYTRQLSIIKEILEMYQSGKDEDTAKVYPLFTEMQDLGSIPDEIMTALLASGNPNPDDPINPAELEALQSIVNDCKTM